MSICHLAKGWLVRMRIYDVSLTGSSASESSRAQDIQRTDAMNGSRTGRAGPGTSDRVEFSSTLGRLSQALSTDASGRASRVQALAAQYQSGSYRPDPMAITKGMIDDALAAGVE